LDFCNKIEPNLYRNLLRSHDCLRRPYSRRSESPNPFKLVEASD
jgi:hypothetical protein